MGAVGAQSAEAGGKGTGQPKTHPKVNSTASAGARLLAEEERRYATLGPQRIPMYTHPVPSSSSEKITGM